MASHLLCITLDRDQNPISVYFFNDKEIIQGCSITNDSKDNNTKYLVNDNTSNDYNKNENENEEKEEEKRNEYERGKEEEEEEESEKSEKYSDDEEEEKEELAVNEEEEEDERRYDDEDEEKEIESKRGYEEEEEEDKEEEEQEQVIEKCIVKSIRNKTEKDYKKIPKFKTIPPNSVFHRSYILDPRVIIIDVIFIKLYYIIHTHTTIIHSFIYSFIHHYYDY